MTVKDDPPGSSVSGETSSLLSHNPPPTYNDSTQSAGPYAQQPLYPSVPPSSRNMPSGPSPYDSIPILVQVRFDQESAIEAADRRARNRFFSALAWGLIIWVSLGILTGGIVGSEGAARRRGSRSWLRVPVPVFRAVSCDGFKPDDVQKARWFPVLHPLLFAVSSSSSTPTYSATSKFSLPVASADTLFLHGAGSWSHGSATFAVDDELEGNQVEVTVVASYNDEGLLQDSQICQVRELIGTKAYRSGMEILTPERHINVDPYVRLSFDVTYRIPPSLSHLASLNVSASIFRVDSPSLPPLGHVRIVTSNSAITIDSVSAETIFLQTSNAPVRVGHATATTSIQVKSSNGRVEGAWDAPVTNITTSNGLIDGDFTVYKSLALSTSNLGINANVALKKSDAFDVRAKTSNGKVNLLYTEQPKGSNLTSDVWTSNLGAVVLHDPQFEGAFSASTSNLPAKITGPLTEEDPSKSHRSRQINVHSTGKSAAGEIWWSGKKGDGDSDRASRGSTTVRSSNARVEIQFL